MWLLPVISAVANFACRVFYRLEIEGSAPAKTGPLLLLANHPNSLFDPALVAAAADRPVRFLAKSTLFTDSRVGWLVRGSGAIPVHRTHEVDGAAQKNVEMFESVFEELKTGAAVGIFPEGRSHSEPSLGRLKTGAARMALGFYERERHVFPLVPVGLTLRDKGVFRSSALVLRGDPVAWEDLADRGAQDREAVNELTERIEVSLREVTVNLEQWEDRALVETVEAIWTASDSNKSHKIDRVKRSQAVAAALAELRRRGDSHWRGLAHDVDVHRRRLARLGLKPIELGVRVDLGASFRWAVRRLHLLLPLAVICATAGWVLFFLPFRLTDVIFKTMEPKEDQYSTYKTLIGAPLYLLWILLLSGVAWWIWGPLSGLFTIVLVPIVGAAGLVFRERLKGAWSDVRQFFRLRTRSELVDRLRADQARLAASLAAVYETIEAPDIQEVN